jgi:hypothetical protein
MSGVGDYILGMVGLLLIAVSMAIAGRTARRALLPGWTGAPALLADGILAVAILVAVSELLGLFGLLDGVLLVLACLIVGGGGVRLEPMLIRAAHQEGAEPGQREAPALGRRGRIELGAAIAISLLVAAQWAAPTLLALDRGIYGGDSLWYHLPFSAHIAHTGSVTELLFTDPLYLNWFYPQVSELLHADGLLVLGDDVLSPLLNLAWLGVALMAAWCIGRPYGAGAPALAAAAALMSANLLFSRQPGNANNDVVAIALFLAAVAILVNGRRVDGVWRAGALFTAALAAGLALGTKLTVVPPVLALTVGVIWISKPGWRRQASTVWIGGLALGGGLWYLRNLIVSGNPFPWLGLGPIEQVEELQGRDPYAIVHYITDTDVWGRFFVPGLEERLGDLWPLVLGLAVFGTALWIWRDGRLERMLAAVAVVSAIAYLVTPLGASGPEGSPVGFRLNIRYLAPGLALALVLAAIPSPLVRGREGLWRLGSLLIFGALIVISAGAVERIDTTRLPGTVVLALAVVAVPVALALLGRRGVSRTALAGVGAVILIALAGVGRLEQTDYLEHRYSSKAPDFPTDSYPGFELSQGLGAAYDFMRGQRGSSVALSGTLGAFYQYGLWGEDASNDVTYLGERGERGSFREIQECPEWIGAINSGDYDYVITTAAYEQDDPEGAVVAVQRAWIAAARNARRVAGSNLVDVWELTGVLDPAACARAPQSTLSAPG